MRSYTQIEEHKKIAIEGEDPDEIEDLTEEQQQNLKKFNHRQ